MRGATAQLEQVGYLLRISIHAPHAGRDVMISAGQGGHCGISIHAPHAGRDEKVTSICVNFDYFNPRAPCGARRHHEGVQERDRNISIHAPHAGRDQAAANGEHRPAISIHAPHAGRDLAESA